MRKLGKLLLTIAMCFTMMSLPLSTLHAAVTGGGFPDLPRSHWAHDTMLWAQQQGIIEGMPNGNVAPDRLVTQAEFTAMVNRAFVPDSGYEADYEAIEVPRDSVWDLRDYMYAVHMNWAVSNDKRNQVMTRGEVAELLVSMMGINCTVNGSIQYLLDNGLARGKTSATIAGFKAGDTLSRAEAATFIYNLHSKNIEIAPRPDRLSAECAASGQPADDLAVAGLMMHDSEAKVLDTLGEPAMRLASQYGFDWYIYNEDYKNYIQVGIHDGKVVGLLTTSKNWSTPDGIGSDSTFEDVIESYGDPLTYILKGNTQYMQSDLYDKRSVYLRGDYYLTVYYDTHEDHQIAAVQLIDKSVEEQLRGYYGKPSDELARSFEKQIFEMANSARALRGLETFEWDETAAETARKHSRNMADLAFFDHDDPAGNTPFDRMREAGIVYNAAAENIAYGQQDALEAHIGWMNSKTGHREALLNTYERLGVGVYLNSDGVPYYTQNFYTPYKLLSIHH